MLIVRPLASAVTGLAFAFAAIRTAVPIDLLRPTYVAGPLALMAAGSAGLAGFFASELLFDGFKRLR